MSKKNIKPEYITEANYYFDYFHAAVTDILADRSAGVTAAHIAAAVGISKSLISGIVHSDPARRIKPSFQVQVAIAKFLGFTLCDFLAKGRRLVEGDQTIKIGTYKQRRIVDMVRIIIAKDTDQSRAFKVLVNTLFRDMQLNVNRQVIENKRKTSGGGGRRRRRRI